MLEAIIHIFLLINSLFGAFSLLSWALPTIGNDIIDGAYKIVHDGIDRASLKSVAKTLFWDLPYYLIVECLIQPGFSFAKRVTYEQVIDPVLSNPAVQPYLLVLGAVSTITQGFINQTIGRVIPDRIQFQVTARFPETAANCKFLLQQIIAIFVMRRFIHPLLFMALRVTVPWVIRRVLFLTARATFQGLIVPLLIMALLVVLIRLVSRIFQQDQKEEVGPVAYIDAIQSDDDDDESEVTSVATTTTIATVQSCSA